MRVNIPVGNPELRKHLAEQFPYMRVQECCGILAPPENTVIEVMEELQSCHPTNPPAPDLKPGKYLVGLMANTNSFFGAQMMRHSTSHIVELHPVDDLEKRIDFICGYSFHITADWRGCRRSTL